MWFQVFFYSFVVSLVATFCGIGGELGIKELIKSALPVTFNRFWYVTAYFGLFFAIPLLNKFVFSIDKETAKKALVIMLVLFSVLGILGEPMRTYKGYSVLWLIVLYLIGAIANKIELFKNTKHQH
jgi:surface polysaccharide O-acyltransferase-like enzyme